MQPSNKNVGDISLNVYTDDGWANNIEAYTIETWDKSQQYPLLAGNKALANIEFLQLLI